MVLSRWPTRNWASFYLPIHFSFNIPQAHHPSNPSRMPLPQCRPLLLLAWISAIASSLVSQPVLLHSTLSHSGPRVNFHKEKDNHALPLQCHQCLQLPFGVAHRRRVLPPPARATHACHCASAAITASSSLGAACSLTSPTFTPNLLLLPPKCTLPPRLSIFSKSNLFFITHSSAG